MTDTEKQLREELERIKNDRRKDEEKWRERLDAKLDGISTSQSQVKVFQETTSMHIEGIHDRLREGDTEFDKIKAAQKKHEDECEEREKRLAALEHDHAITKWLARALATLGLGALAAKFGWK